MRNRLLNALGFYAVALFDSFYLRFAELDERDSDFSEVSRF